MVIGTDYLSLTVSAILFATFIAIEKRTKEPLIQLQIFKITRNLLSGNIVMAFIGAALVSALATTISLLYFKSYKKGK